MSFQTFSSINYSLYKRDTTPNVLSSTLAAVLAQVYLKSDLLDTLLYDSWRVY